MSCSLYKSAFGVLFVGLACLNTHDASANVSSVPGFGFRAFNTSQQSYLTGTSGTYAGLQNTSSSYVLVTGQIPYSSASTVYVSAKITNLTYCQAVVTNGVGNGAWVGSTVYGQTGNPTWQTLNLGIPPSASGTSLIVRCNLEPGSYLGIAYQ